MKKNILIFGIIVILLGAGYYLATSTKAVDTTSDREENTEVISDGESDDNQRDVLEDLMEESTQFPQQYIAEGEKCKTHEDTVKRGDCFQTINESYLDWYIQTETEEFYFPIQHEQEHWKNIFYYDIDENDELGTLNKTEHYDDYAGSSNSLYQRAIDSVDEN